MGPGGSKRSTRDEPETGGVREGHLSAGDARGNMIGGGPRLAPFGAAVLRHGAGQVCRGWREDAVSGREPGEQKRGRPDNDSRSNHTSTANRSRPAQSTRICETRIPFRKSRRRVHPVSKPRLMHQRGRSHKGRSLARSRVAHPSPHPRRMDTFPFPSNSPYVLFPSAFICGLKSSGLDSQMTVPSH